MQALHTISLSALLLAASLPTFAATAGDAVQAIPVPAAPTLQVAPTAEVAPAAAAMPVAPAEPATTATAQQPITPVAPIAPASEAAAAAQIAPAVPALPATQAAPVAQPAAAAAPAPVAPALPAGAAALGGLVNPQTLALIDQLRALQVTPQQAMGGVGALLGLAQSQLAADQYAQLAGSVPGLEFLGGNASNAAGAGNAVSGVLGRLGALSGLLGGSASPAPQPNGAPVDSLAGVGQAFSVLGMDTSLVGQFAPILLQFLAGQGLAGALLQSLGGIWGVPGVLAPVTPTGTPVAVGG